MEERIRDAIEALVDMDDSGPCENLIRIKGVKTPVIAEAALEAEIFYPPILYRYAAPETRDKLIALLEQDDGGKANNYLAPWLSSEMSGWQNALKSGRNILRPGRKSYMSVRRYMHWKAAGALRTGVKNRSHLTPVMPWNRWMIVWLRPMYLAGPAV